MIVASSALLVMVSVLLAPVANLGYFISGSFVLGIGFLYLALQTNMRKPLSAAWRFHSYSIIYIGLLFATMIANILVSETRDIL